jgi:signal transduction histidine kinase
MHDLVSRAEVLARKRGATLAASAHCDGAFQADPDRIEQAVLILVDNAAKYGPPGGTVELEARTDDGRLRVEVRDRGPGIPEPQLGRVFERFYRAEAGGREQAAGGAGLGLAIAAAIVEGHGGQITANARPGGGTLMAASVPMRGSGATQSGRAR